MSDTQEAMRRRYRSALAARALRVVELLNECRQAGSPSGRSHLLGELHTLKGEARMLGMGTLATLVHAMEDRVLGAAPDWEALSAAADAISLSLAEETPDDLAHDLLLTTCEALDVLPPAAASQHDGEEAEQGTDRSAPEKLAPAGQAQARWIQVEAGLVDQLCETLAMLTTGFGAHAAQLNQWSDPPSPQQVRDGRASAEELKTQLSDTLLLCLGLRLTMVEPTLTGLASHIRMLAKERGKLVDVVVSAHGVRIERDLLELLREPLLHLCTNAVVHGIELPTERGQKPERATIQLTAESSGSTVILRVIDDGRGIDQARLEERALERGLRMTDPAWGKYGLLFESGFSTHDGADEIAGRGVGLDVVKRQVQNARGTIEVSSTLGRGASFSLHLPAALTQEHLIVCEVGNGLYGVPSHLVTEIRSIDGQLPKILRVADEALPLRALSDLVGRSESPGPSARILLLHLFGRAHAAWVPMVLGQFELLRRPTTAGFGAKSGFAASAQLEDGRLVLIWDARALQIAFEASVVTADRTLDVREKAPVRRVLVVDDSIVVRDLIAEILSGAGYEVHTAENGRAALHVMDQNAPGLIVSDLEMPEMDGFQLLEAVRSRSATLPVILVTARSSTADRQRAASLGANAYVAKGEFEGSSLVNIVSRYYPGGP